MSNYESMDQLIYVDGELKKKWDRVIITGEVFRAKLQPKQLKVEDTSYEISIKLDKASYATLKKLRLDSTDKEGNVTEAGNRILTTLKEVELAKKDVKGNPILDEFDEPIKEFSHYQITPKQRKTVNGNPVDITVVMASDNSPVTDFLNEGSKVSVLAQAFESNFEKKRYIGLNIKEVKVHELVAYEGGSGGSTADPWAALGRSAADVPSFGDSPSGDSQASSKASAPEVPDTNMENIDQDIPFN